MYEYRAVVNSVRADGSFHCSVDLGMDVVTPHTFGLAGVRFRQKQKRSAVSFVSHWLLDRDRQVVLRTYQARADLYVAVVVPSPDTPSAASLNQELVDRELAEFYADAETLRGSVAAQLGREPDSWA